MILGKHPVDDSDDDDDDVFFANINDDDDDCLRIWCRWCVFDRDHYEDERFAPGEAVDKMDTVGHRNTGIERL